MISLHLLLSEKKGSEVYSGYSGSFNCECMQWLILK